MLLLFKNYILFSLAAFTLVSCEPPKKNIDTNDVVALIALYSFANSCNVGNGAFWTIDFSTGDDKCTPVKKVAEGSKIIIYEEIGLPEIRSANGITNPNFTSVLAEVENNMLPKIIAATGESSDINGDKKVAIVFANLSGSSLGNTYVAGYFNPLDLFRSPGFGIQSNEREVIFIDGVLLIDQAIESAKKNRPNDYYSTIAHEFQHLVRYPFEIGKGSITAPIPFPTTNSELTSILNTDALWINEGTSEVVSDIAGYGPQASRLACLRSDPSYGCTNSINGKSLYNFIGRISDYSYSYAFMKFVYENSGNSVTTRNTFIRATIRGGGTSSTSSGAKGISGLSSMFTFHAERYNSTILLTSSSDIIARLSAAFHANFFRYPNANTSVGKFNLGTDVDLSSGTGNALLTTYAMPSSLAQLTANPSVITLVNNSPTSFELDPGQMFRVSGTAPTLTAKTNVHLVRNSTTEYFIFNGVTSETSGYTTASTSIRSTEESNSEIPLTKPVWSPSKIDARAGVDPSKYLRDRQMWLSRYLVR
jgi:hypothetical protein